MVNSWYQPSKLCIVLSAQAEMVPATFWGLSMALFVVVAVVVVAVHDKSGVKRNCAQTIRPKNLGENPWDHQDKS